MTISWGSWGPVGVIDKKKGARHVPGKMGLVGGFYNPGFAWVRSDLDPAFKSSADIGKVKKKSPMAGASPKAHWTF